MHFPQRRRRQAASSVLKKVYVTGLIRDGKTATKCQNRKGNVIDPLDMIDGISLDALLEKRTANMMQEKIADKIRQRHTKRISSGYFSPRPPDALRFTLAALASQQAVISTGMMKRFRGAIVTSCNKLWNASRYVLIEYRESHRLVAPHYQPSS